VTIGGIAFQVNTVNEARTQINGLVLPAGKEIAACGACGGGQVPCKGVKVKNPGGKSRDVRVSAIPLYNLKPGPAPIPDGASGFGPSTGGETLTIHGNNLSFVRKVQFGGLDATIDSQRDGRIKVTAPPHVAGTVTIVLFDIDCAAPAGTTVPGGGFRYDPSKVAGFGAFYVVGPGESVSLVSGPSVAQNISCIVPGPGNNVAPPSVTISSVAVLPPGVLPGVRVFTADGSFDCRGCTCALPSPDPCPRTVTGNINFTLGNAAAAADANLRLAVTRTAQVRFEQGPRSQCAGSF
jgi:hypothetical protein